MRLEEKLRPGTGEGRTKVPPGYFDKLLEMLLELSASGTRCISNFVFMQERERERSLDMLLLIST